MGIDGREIESGKKTDSTRGRAQVYTGAGYVSGQQPVRRKIGSLVESERSIEAAPADSGTSVRRTRAAQSAQQSAAEGTTRRSRHAESVQKTETESSVRRSRYAEGEQKTETEAPAQRSRYTDNGQKTETEAPVRRSRYADNEQKTEASARRNRRTETESEVSGQQHTSIGGWKERMQERKRKRIRRVLMVFGGILLTAYAAVAIYFGLHFYEGTMIYGIDCSQMTVDEVKAEVADKLDEYVLQVVGRNDRIESIDAKQIELTFVDNSSIDRMLRAQHSYVWPIMILLEKSSLSSVAFSYDQDKAKEALEELNCMNASIAVAPQDAYMTVTDTGFEVVPEVMGTTLDPEKTLETVLDALDKGASSVSLEEKECYVNPQVYSDNEALVQEAEAKNKLAQAYITYDFGDRWEVVNAPVIAEWIAEMSDGTYVIDDMAVTEYVESLAAKYDTFGLTRTFYTSIGTVETLTGGDYGWCIDQDATIVALMQALESGYQGTMEPEYLFTGMCRDTNDIGDTYVEICITQQRMWCYKDGVCIVDTPVVTGNPNKDNATPSGGVWAIDAKKRDAILEGEGYEAPVDYWMPFNEDVGIHDFKERYHFGGTIYLTNGSHGCVNTPYEAVQTIYDAVSIGTPVIVYE